MLLMMDYIVAYGQSIQSIFTKLIENHWTMGRVRSYDDSTKRKNRTTIIFLSRNRDIENHKITKKKWRR